MENLGHKKNTSKSCKYKENEDQLNVSFCIFFVKHFLLYLEL